MKKLFFITTLLYVFSLTSSATTLAGGKSSFNWDYFKSALNALYLNLEEPAHHLSDVDKEEMINAIAEEIAELPAGVYNDLTTFLCKEYIENPTHWPTLEALFKKLYEKVAEELQKQETEHPSIILVDRTLNAFIIAYSLGYGVGGAKGIVKGFWQSRGQGLKFIDKFRIVAESMAEKASLVKSKGKKILGIGLAWSGSAIIYNYLETKRLDPQHRLRETQKEIIKNIAERFASMRDTLKSKTPDTTDNLVINFDELEKELEKNAQNLAHLYKTTPTLRKLMRPIAEDFRTIKQEIRRLKKSDSEQSLDKLIEDLDKAEEENQTPQAPR